MLSQQESCKGSIGVVRYKGAGREDGGERTAAARSSLFVKGLGNNSEAAPAPNRERLACKISSTEAPWFARVYAESYQSAFAYARKLVGEADAEDVVQEAFLRLARYKQDERTGVSKHFVLAMTRNVAFSSLGTKLRERERCTIAQGGAITGEGACDTPNHTDASSHPAIRYLDQLSEGQRDAFVLTELLGLSEVQAGLALAISRPVVNAKKCRAVEVLRSRVVGQDVEMGESRES